MGAYEAGWVFLHRQPAGCGVAMGSEGDRVALEAGEAEGAGGFLVGLDPVSHNAESAHGAFGDVGRTGGAMSGSA